MDCFPGQVLSHIPNNKHYIIVIKKIVYIMQNVNENYFQRKIF